MRTKDVILQTMTWITLIIFPVLFVWPDAKGNFTDLLEWAVDVTWSFEILIKFISADFHNRTLKATIRSYLKFWFWIDAASTIPAMIYYQKNEYANLSKFLRILHFFDLFSPFRLLLEFIMPNAIER